MEKLSDKEMILETYLTVKQLEKRVERHGGEHREDFDRLSLVVKEGFEKAFEEHHQLSTRITKLESERSTLKWVIGFIISLFSGGAGGYFFGGHK